MSYVILENKLSTYLPISSNSTIQQSNFKESTCERFRKIDKVSIENYYSLIQFTQNS